jgi:hypothetical protein
LFKGVIDMTATQTAEPANYDEVVQTILEWPPAAQADLAQTIIRALAQDARADLQVDPRAKDEPRNRHALREWLRTRPKTGLPAPTDEEVAQWIDEYRMEKYG